MPNIPFPTDMPFSIDGVRNEFERLLDRVWHAGLRTAPLDGQDWAPPLDVLDRTDHYLIRAEVPGVMSDQVEVTFLENTVTIKGVKSPPPTPQEESRTLRRECRYGGFCRRYEFPAPVDDGAVTAQCKNGVLEIKVPKTAQARGKTVKVTAVE